MRLVLLFSEEHLESLRRDDIIVSAFTIADRKTVDINQVHIPLEFEKDSLERELSNYRQEVFHNDEELSEILLANTNNFYNHIFGTVLKWRYTIKEILKNNKISEIVISDIVQQNFYLPYYEAEGEINSKLFYKSYDFLPQMLVNWLSDVSNLQISIIKTRSKFSLHLRVFVRRHVLLFLKLLFNCYNNLVFSLKNSKKASAGLSKKIDTIVLSRGLAHTHFALPFINEFNDTTVLHISDGLKSKDKNLNYLMGKNGTPYCASLHYISMWDVLVAQVRTYKRLYRLLQIEKKRITVNNISYNVRSSLVEMIIGWFEVEMHGMSLENYLITLQHKYADINLRVLTCEMLTPYPFIVKKISNKYNIDSYQIQSTLMINKPQTNFVFCKTFFTKSSLDAKYFRSKGISNIVYIGSLLKLGNSAKNRDLKRLVFFTQPYEKENEYEIIEFILKNFPEKQLSLKLHPRDKAEQYNCFRDQVSIISADQHLSDISEFIDVAILRTSSIAHEIILEGILTLYCLNTPADKRVQATYLTRDYVGKSIDLKSLRENLQSLDSLIDDFSKYRTSYISELELKDHTFFYERLKELNGAI